MKKSLFLVALFVFLALGWSVWRLETSTCPAPLHYRIGRLDAEFGLSEVEARAAIASAGNLWEESAGRTLFVYDPDATFTVNFIFDERQEYSDAEQQALTELEVEKAAVAEASATYDKLAETLAVKREDFDENNLRYEADVAAYNAQVSSYNDAGGAPPDAYAALEDERARLERVANRLQTAAEELKARTNEVNEAGSTRAEKAALYNEHVRAFNQQYAGGREFTQGDYQGDQIHIYSFTNEIELERVLAHELGHALSLDHVDDVKSVMYYLLDNDARSVHLTASDTEELFVRCGS